MARTKTQVERVAQSLQRGVVLSSRQIANRLGTSTNRARFIISELRYSYPVRTTSTVSRNGVRTNRYSF